MINWHQTTDGAYAFKYIKSEAEHYLAFIVKYGDRGGYDWQITWDGWENFLRSGTACIDQKSAKRECEYVLADLLSGAIPFPWTQSDEREEMAKRLQAIAPKTPVGWWYP